MCILFIQRVLNNLTFNLTIQLNFQMVKQLLEKLEQENSELQGMLKNIPDEIIE